MDFHAAEIAPSRRTSTSCRTTRSTSGSWPASRARSCTTAGRRRSRPTSPTDVRALIVDPVQPGLRPGSSSCCRASSTSAPSPGRTRCRRLDWQRMLDLAPDYVTFNGVAGLYATHPLEVGVNQPLRFLVVNAGPNRVSSVPCRGRDLRADLARRGRYPAARRADLRSAGRWRDDLRRPPERGRDLSLRVARLRGRHEGAVGMLKAGIRRDRWAATRPGRRCPPHLAGLPAAGWRRWRSPTCCTGIPRRSAPAPRTQ